MLRLQASKYQLMPNSRIFLPKLGWMRFRNSRDILGTAKNITISQVGGKWFASIQTEREVPTPTPLHKKTAEISKNFRVVAVEDLQINNMSRSAAGSAEKPGKNVAAKSGLNKAILDQGWFEFRRQLQYKLEWNGGMLMAVPAHYTSQTCPCCGQVAKANRKTQAKFECVDCGYENHADVVGAMNILARGYRVAACGEDGSGLARKRRTQPASVKQEPTEVTMHEETHA
jgi:putative transposase